MKTNWQTFCRVEGLCPNSDSVEVTFETGRHQIVQVEEDDSSFHLVSLVARTGVVADLGNASLMAWQRNRTSALVGFRVDAKGRMVAETWIPKAGLMADEFVVYLQTLTIEADRFEHQLTGRDVR